MILFSQKITYIENKVIYVYLDDKDINMSD